MADPCVPVRERCPGAAAAAECPATAEGCALILREGAGLADVLGRDPEAVAVDDGCTVIAPAWPRRIREVVIEGPAKPVRRTDALGRYLQRAGSRGAERGERRAGIVVVADQRERHDPLAVGIQ